MSTPVKLALNQIWDRESAGRLGFTPRFQFGRRQLSDCRASVSDSRCADCLQCQSIVMRFTFSGGLATIVAWVGLPEAGSDWSAVSQQFIREVTSHTSLQHVISPHKEREWTCGPQMTVNCGRANN